MRRSGPRVAIVAVLLVGAIIFGGVYYAWSTFTDIFQPVAPSGKGKTVSVEVTSGDTTAQIADQLQEKGLIRNALAFRVWARVKGLDTHLEAGIYKKINSSMTISDIIDELQNAQPDAIRVLIPEGWRLEQIAQRFSAQKLPNFNAKDFLNFTRHIDRFPDRGKYPLLQSIPEGKSMEGFLFPSSYEVPVDADARVIVDLLLRTTTDIIKTNKLDILAEQHKLNVYQMFTLASIVEREAGANSDTTERNNIASVYWNRIFKPNDETVGLLQADPTVQYARDTQSPPKTYWLPLDDTGSNIAKDSPWNTYVTKGLPPSPICSPGLASLKAAAAPPDTGYYYFLTRKDNGHAVFAKTLAEFQQDQQKYL